MLFDGLYDAIYNKVEEAGLAIQDVVSSATSPDVNKYIDENPSSSKGDNGKKKKKKHDKILSDFKFAELIVEMESSGYDGIKEVELVDYYRYGKLITDEDYIYDFDKAYHKLRKAYGRGKNIFDILEKEGYTAKLKDDGSWKIKKIKKEKPVLNSSRVSAFQNIEIVIAQKVEELFTDIVLKCKSDDEIENVLMEMIDNNELCVSIDLSDFLLDLIEPLKELRKELSPENKNAGNKEI